MTRLPCRRAILPPAVVSPTGEEDAWAGAFWFRGAPVHVLVIVASRPSRIAIRYRLMTHYEMRPEPSVVFRSWAIVATDGSGNERFVMRYLTQAQAELMLKRLQIMGAAVEMG